MTPQDKSTTNTRPIGTLSIDVKVIFDRLIQCSVGDIVRYDELNSLVGRNVREKGVWILSSARRRAFTQHRMLFAPVRGVGVKRLNDVEIIDTGKDALGRIHRMSLRGTRRMTAVQNFDALPADKKLQHNTYLSALGILGHITKERGLKKLEAHVQKSQVALPLQKTLAAFQE